MDRQRQLEADAKELGRFGYAQQLLRDMGGFANFAVSFTIISILTGAIVLFGHGLNHGGPLVNTLGWPIVAVFTLAVAASMAEIASKIPTAGAMYHWSSILGGPGWGWLTAWVNFIGQMATTAGIDYGIALFVVDLMGWQGYTLHVYALLLLSHGLINHYGIRAVSLCNDVSVWYHIVLTLGLAAAVLFFMPRQPVSFLVERHNASGYPYWWAFLVGLLQAQWTLTGYDASAHVTEETVDPRRNAPWGMFMAVALSGVFGYILIIALTLAIRDLPAVASSPNPFIAICGTKVTWAVLVAMWFCGLSSVTTNARMAFAFARDGGMPLSKTWARVSPRFRTPANAVWLSVGLAFVIGLYSKAFTVIASISTIGLYVSYVIPVALVLRARRRGQWKELGPWNLGKWGGFVNAAAVAWVAFITVLFVAPPNLQTGYTFGALLALLGVYYFVAVKGKFKGPVAAH